MDNNKLIVIADSDEQSVIRIQKIMRDAGYNDIRSAANGSALLQLLRANRQKKDNLALVIINQSSLQLDFHAIYEPLSKGENGVFIPFVILTEGHIEQKNDASSGINGLVYYLNKNFLPPELLLLTELLFTLKSEFQLRIKQEQELLFELSERKVIDAKMNYLVAHDELTGFLNRSALENKIRSTLQKPYQGGLLYVDVDRFSLINEIEGFTTGDFLIVEIAGLIRNSVTTQCLFARIGSDEFILFFEDKTENQILKIAEKIRARVDAYHFNSGSTCYSITVSVGMICCTSDYALLHPNEMISMAHQACQIAKTNGRNMVWAYKKDEKIIRDRHKDVFWLPLIKEALQENRFFLEFQPIVKLSDGIISHYEALIRLQDQNGDVISPVEFIPAAERMGMIHNIDLFVVKQAISFMATLPENLQHIILSINLSSVAFQDASLLPAIKQMLYKTGVNAGRITFEITETAAVENFKETRNMIEEIRDLGCSFALDDFGAGFSSFSYLKEFPVDYLKIDGQFIRNVVEDETDQVLVRSMCEIAKKLEKRTIAEYVDSPQVISLLKEIGVDYGQGYIFGKPKRKLLRNQGAIELTY